MHKTEFLTSTGLYKNIVMLFGLCSAYKTFQIVMNLIFTCFINEFVTIYIDNILVYFKTY